MPRRLTSGATRGANTVPLDEWRRCVEPPNKPSARSRTPFRCRACRQRRSRRRSGGSRAAAVPLKSSCDSRSWRLVFVGIPAAFVYDEEAASIASDAIAPQTSSRFPGFRRTRRRSTPSSCRTRRRKFRSRAPSIAPFAPSTSTRWAVQDHPVDGGARRSRRRSSAPGDTCSSAGERHGF